MPETSFSQLAGRPVPATGSGGYQVPMWRAIAVFRFVALGYVVVLALRNLSQYARPAAAVAALLVMAGWTVFTAYAYAQPGPRRWPLLTADLVIALAALLVTPFVVGRAALNAGVPTLGIAWLAASVAGFEIWREEIRQPYLTIVEPAMGNRIVTAIEAASPTQIVETSDLMYCMVS